MSVSPFLCPYSKGHSVRAYLYSIQMTLFYIFSLFSFDWNHQRNSFCGYSDFNKVLLIKSCVGLSLQVNLCQKLLFLHQSTNPQYDDRLFMELQYMKITSSEHGENMLCTEIVFDIQNTFCTHHVPPMFCRKKSY